MRAMFYSNSPLSMSAYGRILREVCRPLVEHGHEIAVACNWGHPTSLQNWAGVQLYPQTGSGLSELPALDQYKLYGGEILISVYDLWVLDHLPKEAVARNIPFIGYVPFDHANIPLRLREKLEFCLAIIPMSEYGGKLVREAGFTNSRVITPGVHTQIYKPLLGEQFQDGGEITKGWLRTELASEISPEDFVVGMVQMNKDHLRKQPSAQMEAVKLLQDRHPDQTIHLYIHAYNVGGMDLAYQWKELQGDPNLLHLPDPTHFSCGWNDLELAKLYNAFDVLLECTAGEGFGMPVPEAMACGVPVIMSDNTSGPELLEKTPELLVKTFPTWAPIPARVSIPYVDDIVDKLELVMNRGTESYTQTVRDISLKYDWKHIIPQWISAFEWIGNELDRVCWNIPDPSPLFTKWAYQVRMVE